MDHHTSSDAMRLDRLEKRAQAYFKAGKAKGNLPRLVRAVRLETAVNSTMLKMLTVEIEGCRN